jgi:hypothetical protein
LFATRAHHRIKNLHIARAATKIPSQSITNVGLSRVWISFEEIYGRHHHARRADAALRASAINERLLNCVQLIPSRNAFNRFDGCAFNLRYGHETTVHNSAIDENGTRAAFAFTATFLRSGEVQLLAQYVE